MDTTTAPVTTDLSLSKLKNLIQQYDCEKGEFFSFEKRLFHTLKEETQLSIRHLK
jgi:hypothetical protein